ncbi:uncharacterized protein LOC143235176 isoform X5 [Tachypleus tridentatus]|uniref:uncharacterized protein LOC143235176 isoform X5 n=1 Tax=Tachypleus tridentatus TaxID=6853 RepID=UPI003FD0072A
MSTMGLFFARHPQIERVKFGVPLDQVCKQDIPGPLLVLILKLNKEGPYKKDVFRAPGHQGNMKKLVHFLQHGRLVNIDNFSVYTIASVLKKFLRKLPGGIFGPQNEERLFSIIDLENTDEKCDEIHRLIISLPSVAQHLLVLLVGTFHTIATSAERAQTGMSSEALGVSVAPSFFQSCVSNGKMAKMEDVIRFKVATRIMKFLIDNFGVSNLFGRENYEYYARITGHVLKVEEDWVFAFRYPPDTLLSRKASLEAEKLWLHQEAEQWGLRGNLEAISSQEECQSTPALIHASEPMVMAEGPPPSGSLTNLGEGYTRLSLSLEENGLYKGGYSPSLTYTEDLTLDELKVFNHYAESTKSLSFLPQVHERQTARMRTRSEWFLNPSPCPSPTPVSMPLEAKETSAGAAKVMKIEGTQRTSIASSLSSGSVAGAAAPCSASERHLIRRTSSKEKKLIRRSSSKNKQDKENGKGSGSKLATSHSSGTLYATDLGTEASPRKSGSVVKVGSSHGITDQDCTEEIVHTYHVTLTYKPRI